MSTKQKKYKSVGAYIIDLLIIIFGITISFFLNEYRENIKEKKLERMTLVNISENLATDTLEINMHIKKLDALIKHLEPLLEEQKSEGFRDSIGVYLDAFVSYSRFFKTDMGFQEMTSTGNSKRIRDRQLLNNIILYYTKSNEFLKEWNGIDKGFVLNHTLPYFHGNFAYSNYGQLGYSFNKNKESLIEVEKVIKQDQFKNLVRDNILFKMASRYAFEMNKKAAIKLLKEINDYLN